MRVLATGQARVAAAHGDVRIAAYDRGLDTRRLDIEKNPSTRVSPKLMAPVDREARLRPGRPPAPRGRQFEVGEVEPRDSSGAHDRPLDTSQMVVVPGVVRVKERDEVRCACVD